MNNTPGLFTVEWPEASGDGSLGWEYYDRIEVGPSMEAALPHAPGQSIRLVSWRVGAGPWLSPIDGFPMDARPNWPHLVDRLGCFTLILDVAGDAVCLQQALIFDRRTNVIVAVSVDWFGEERTDGEAIVRFSYSELRHRADLLLTLPVTYGPPEVRELALTEGSTQRFDAHATAEVLGCVHGEILSRRNDTNALKWQWDPNSKNWPLLHAAIAFAPLGLDAKFQVRVDRESEWERLKGPSQASWISGIPAGSKTIELQYLPHAVRLQFNLPPPVNLPQVDDLLQTDLGDMRIGSDALLKHVLTQSLQLEVPSSRNLQLDELRYPFTLKDATPEALMDYVREHADPGAAIDMRKFAFKAPGRSITERLKSWAAAVAHRVGL